VRITAASSLPTTYGRLAPVGYLARFEKQAKKDVRFTIVGYGVQDWKPVIVATILRMRATVSLVNLVNANIRDWSVEVSGSPGKGTGPGGICYGDSGGPLLHAGPSGDVIVGVASYVVGPNCTGPAGFYRVDTAYAQRFIAGG
jgi:secreted trypsin-like serine protease